MYWRLIRVLMHTCHLSWVACTGVTMMCSCIYASYKVTRTGDLVIEEGLTKGKPWVLRARLVIESLYCIFLLLIVWQLPH